MSTKIQNPQDDPSPRAYSYIRFSSRGQANGDSMRRQKEASQKYASEHGLIIDQSVEADTGVSAYRGKNALKGHLADFLRKVEQGVIPQGSVLIVENLDRLSRAPILESTEIIGSILRAGIDIVTLTDGLRHRAADIRSNSYAYMLPVMSLCRAFEESRRKSERVGAAWANKRKRARAEGHILTARGPAWLVKTKNGWVPIPEKVAIIQRIFALALQGWGRYRISEYLNLKLILPFSQGQRKGNGWHPTYIARLLNERKVLGELQPGTSLDGRRCKDGQPISDYYPPIIEEATWLKVNQRKKPSPGRPSPIINLFQGLLKDGYTHAAMRFCTKGKKEEHHTLGVWIISDSRRLGMTPDAKPPAFICAANWPYRHFEGFVLKFLRELDWQEVRNHGKTERQTQLETEETLGKAQLSEIENAQKRALEALRSTATPPALLAKELTRLEEESVSCQARLTSICHELADLVSTSAHLNDLPDLSGEYDSESRLRLRCEIRRRVKAIHVYTQGLPNELGVILTPLPSIEIELANGHSRFAIAGTNNPFPRPIMPALQPRMRGKFRKMSQEEHDRARNLTLINLAVNGESSSVK